jgi:hypothetical protein
MRPELVDIMRTVNGFLYKESKSTGRPLDYRVACARDGSILIDSVRLQLTKGRTGIPAQLLDYNNIVNEVRKAGYTNPFAKYWIWYDGMSPLPGVGGIASMVDDDRLAADNGNNFGPMYGVFYGITGGFGATVMMHEGSHILGAVMPGSPNSSGSFHCNDGDDVMCYQDGGPNSNGYNERACPTAMKFDCNKNDYFNPKPKAGSWLATHWNLGSPLNRFFAGCQYATGLVQAAAGGQALDEAVRAQIPQWSDVAARTVKISKGCRGRYFALYSAISLQPSAIDKAEGNVPGHDLSMGVPVGDHIIGGGRPEDSIVNRVPVDFDVCYFAGSKLLSCRSEVGTDFGKVPAKATKARVVAKAAANASFILSIV